MRIRLHLLRTAAAGLIVVAAAPGPGASAADPPLNNGLIAGGGGTSIQAMDSDGRSSHTIVPVGVSDAAVPRVVSPAWSPDGTQLAFELDGDIAVTDFRGAGLRRITATETVFEREPAWSPDGSQMAFVRDGQIWVVGADGAGQRQVTTVCCNGSPTWSPDGTQLAFESDRGGGWQIHAITLASGEPSVQLTESAGPNRWPDWSPDGSSIAFASLRFDRLADIWVMAADGSNELAVTTRQSYNTHPAWSPDGGQILYSEGSVARTVRPDGTADRFVGAIGLEPDWQPLPACTITGTEEFEALDGTPGDDVICGLGGNDAIRGGPGDDILLGGPGEDTLVFDQVFSGVQVNLQTASAEGEGKDLVLLNEHVRGSHGGDVLQGNEEANYLRGDAGDDLVDGGPGPDRLEGGVGQDTSGSWRPGQRSSTSPPASPDKTSLSMTCRCLRTCWAHKEAID
jgi:Ca2+-binding RTX toxin-like protein